MGGGAGSAVAGSKSVWKRRGARGGNNKRSHLQPWPRAQRLRRPASALILLSGGDPAFCQSGGRQQGEGRGRGGASVPRRTPPAHPGHSSSVRSHGPVHLSDPLRPQGSRQGKGLGSESRPRKGRNLLPSRQGVPQEAPNPTTPPRPLFPEQHSGQAEPRVPHPDSGNASSSQAYLTGKGDHRRGAFADLEGAPPATMRGLRPVPL